MTSDLKTQVEISISCRNLCDTDVLSKSDPMVVVYEASVLTEKWCELGRTEMIKNNLNPNFSKKMIMDYHFEEQQRLKFEVFDIDNNSFDLSKQDFLGQCTATLGEIVSSGTLERTLSNGPINNKGSVILVMAEELSACHDEIRLSFNAKKVDKKDIFGLSDPFLAFHRVNENGSLVVVHRTEVVKSTLNPSWKPVCLPLRVLSNGDNDRPIVIQCIDWNRSGKEDLIGEVRVTTNELLHMQQSGEISLPLINPRKAKRKKHYADSGLLLLNGISIQKVHSFIEYVQGGTELSCCIAIDFTASNGCPQTPTTLHYCTSEQPSKYSVALQAVGEIIRDYDSDNLFPAFGFGARIPPHDAVSHNFPLNGEVQNPYCQGISGVLDAYRHSLRTVTLHGPTNFAPIITQVANLAQEARDGSEYFILLILTDGIICDMPQTKAAIVNASCLPVSIIIVGIGSADFTAMEELDGDDVRLTSRGRRAARDIVQFVPFDDFCNASSLVATKRQLAKAVLAEIPDQLVSYMRSKAFMPRPNSGLHRNRQPATLSGPPYPLPTAPPYPLI